MEAVLQAVVEEARAEATALLLRQAVLRPQVRSRRPVALRLPVVALLVVAVVDEAEGRRLPPRSIR